MTAGSSNLMVPESESISASIPTGTVKLCLMWPIIEPYQAGTPSGAMWSSSTAGRGREPYGRRAPGDGGSKETINAFEKSVSEFVKEGGSTSDQP